MKILLTGATGYLGSAIAGALAHHDLLRERRDLRDPSTYVDDATSADAIVHAAITSGADRLEVDRAFVEAFASPKLIYTSVMFVLGNVEHGDESSPAHGFRAETERIVLDAGGAVIRPGMMWGGNAFLFDHPIHIGSGANRWPLVHRDDAAQLYRLVVDGGQAIPPGRTGRIACPPHESRGIFHAVSEVLRAADVFPGKGLPLEEARKNLGGFADALALDQDVTATRSAALGWRPTRRWR